MIKKITVQQQIYIKHKMKAMSELNIKNFMKSVNKSILISLGSIS